MTIIREERIGGQRLILGDCLAVMQELGRFDAVVTDPPFGISDAPIKGQGRTGKRKGGEAVWFKPSDWDHCLNPKWGAVCVVAPVVAWFGQWRKRGEVEAFMPHPLRSEIVWAKDCHVGAPSPVAPRDERIWIFSDAGIKPATFETSVWDHPIIPTWAKKHHKNEKPVSLMARLIKWIGAGSVLDPFCGSASTIVACQRLGVSGTGIEIDPDHFETACRRVEEATRQPDLFVAPPEAPKQETLL